MTKDSFTETESPTPWRVERFAAYVDIEDADGNRIVDQAGQYEDSGVTLSLKDAERIVVCVNACRGIPSDELVFLPEAIGLRKAMQPK